MERITIENPVINAPFEKPQRHFRFTEDGITNEILEEKKVRNGKSKFLLR